MYIYQTNTPLVSIIIPTYRDWDRLNQCLKALSKQSYPKDKIEIIVVNNYPKDDIPKETSYFDVKFIKENIRGSYASRNKGIEYSSGEIIAFTDSDCIPDRLWIEKAINYFNKNSCRLAGHINVFSKNLKPSVAELYDMTFGFDQELNAKNGVSVTANMIVKKSLFSVHGKFNDKMLSGGDLEWSRRLSSKGVSINYAPDVIVEHPARKSLTDLFKKRYRVSVKKKIKDVSNFQRCKVSRYKILKKRILFLFASKLSINKIIGVIVIALVLKVFSYFIRFVVKRIKN